MAKLSKIITIAHIMRERDVSRATARRWLLDLDKKSGGKVILRTGTGPRSKIYTTVARLREADGDWVEQTQFDREDMAGMWQRILQLGEELRLLKRNVAQERDASRAEYAAICKLEEARRAECVELRLLVTELSKGRLLKRPIEWPASPTPAEVT